MADISKCNGNNCTLKDTCYRFTATSNPHWQTFGVFSQDETTGKCEYYWKDVKNEPVIMTIK